MDVIPPINHLILIPFTVGIGFFIGWTLGTRNVRGAWDRAEKRRREREEEEQ